ncbi:type II toxin-antitoxin system MqsR family toxin [Bacillus suaedae]|uniref:Type II toxin-antitoxin system MqsR family toxin n=1 Tax=Halalkalibacter suaedae TaxID=2822140 RepID=A0A940X0Q8_9BACI|nr:type II toxin-antitoxin system MqsR family toxin [Bacillus suaedae]MBP3952224.1 type II toxin-antitoxin system MqsR family toxin [Bacillus suaedae]
MDDVRLFLIEVKKMISLDQKRFIKRKQYNAPGKSYYNYLEALLDIGLTTPAEVWNYILDLTPADYFSGPDQDRNGENGFNLWTFKTEINEVNTYIKLKIDERGCVCLSFHKDWLQEMSGKETKDNGNAFIL